ncbi:MAG: hypothetical protein J1E36_02240 [Eubacterium sp.]|nr:hypothetical protein [Eubacterium sp.]
MFKKNSFFNYLLKKINQNKDIIILLISSCTLFQVVIIYFLDASVKEWINQHYFFIIMLFAVLLIIIFINIFFYVFSDQLHKTYENFKDVDCLNCSKRNVDILSPDEYKKRMNIYSLKSLEDIERNIKSNEQIWILTSDVKLETTVSNISKIMDTNLKKGVLYTYFIPDIIKNSATILQLENKNKKYSNFDLVIVDKQYKFLFEKIDVVIYSPNNENRKGFICINFSNSDETHYFKRLSDEDLLNLIGQLKKIRGKYNEKQKD